MPSPIVRVLSDLRSTRDFKAAVVELALQAAMQTGPARLRVVDPVINPSTIRADWARLLAVLSPEVRDRLHLEIEDGTRDPRSGNPLSNAAPITAAALGRPNYHYEVLRLLIADGLHTGGGQTLQSLIQQIGASQTPIRAAVSALRSAGIAVGKAKLTAEPASLSMEMLSRLNALPQTLRFRFERGAQVKTPLVLLERALTLLQSSADGPWRHFALSGVPVAQKDVPQLDLVGVPRLELLVQPGRDVDEFDTRLIRLLDDGLEFEPNVLAPAPLVVTVVRADTRLVRYLGAQATRCALPCDVFVSLLDSGLREQAVQYAKGVPA